MLTRGRLALAIAAVSIPVLVLAASASGGQDAARGRRALPGPPDRRAAPLHGAEQAAGRVPPLLEPDREPRRRRPAPAAGARPRHQHHDRLPGDLSTRTATWSSSTPVSEFVFHPAHNHWHLTDVALFEIRTALDDGTDGDIRAVFANQSIKTTFCLIDVIKLEGNSPTGRPQLLGLLPGRPPGHLRGLGRPVPPRHGGPGARDHRTRSRASTTWCRPRTPRGLPRDGHHEQHRLDELPAHARQQGQREGRGDREQPVQRATCAASRLPEPLTQRVRHRRVGLHRRRSHRAPPIRGLGRARARALGARRGGACASCGAEPVSGDLDDSDRSEPAPRAASWPSTPPPRWRTGATRPTSSGSTCSGTQNVIDACRAAGVRRLVHVGTEAALMAGQPLVNVDESAPLRPDSPALYSSSKAKAEELVRAANGDGLETVVVRPRFVWGRGDTTLLPGDRRDGPLGPLPLGRRRAPPHRHDARRQHGRGALARRHARRRPAASTS